MMLLSFVVGAVAGAVAVSLSTDRRRSDAGMTEGLRFQAAGRLDELAAAIEAWLEEAKVQTAGRIRALANAIRPDGSVTAGGPSGSRTLKESEWEYR